MDKYRKVQKPKAEQPKDEDEIRVTAAGRVSSYVSYAAKLFNEMNKSKLTIKATGNALTAAVTLAEVIKRRFKGIHQITALGSTEIVDEYEPLEEGLDKVTDTRSISFVEITLSKEALDTSDKGYQAPIPEDQVKEYDAEEMTRGRGRGRGKGRGKGKGKAKGKGKGKAKGKGKGKADAKGKGKATKGKGKGKSDDKGKGKGKGKDKGKDKGKGKGKDKGKDKGKGKGKDSGKGKSKGKGKSSWDSWGGGYDSYDSWGGGYDSWGKGSKGKGKSKDSGKGKGKGKGKKGW